MIYAERNKQKIVLALSFLYFFSALGYGLVTGKLCNNQLLSADALFYKISGYNLSRGLGYTFDGIMPHGIYQIGYPLFLGGLFTVLFFWILDLTIRSNLAKYIALFLYLTHHVIFYLTSVILSETLGISFFLSFILLSIKYFSSPKTKCVLLASISCGCLILVRNKFQLLPLFLLIISSVVVRRKFFKEALLIFLVSFIMISPVLIRNKITFDQYKLSFHGGEFFFRGMNCSANSNNLFSCNAAAENIAKTDEKYFALLLQDIYKHPARMLKSYIANFIKLNFSPKVFNPKEDSSFLRRFLIVKNIAVFLIILILLFRRKSLSICLKKIDFVFIGLLFLYDNAITSFGISDDLRLGLFSHILMYILFALILDSVYSSKISLEKRHNGS
ncbi:MAG: hypothetical protein WC330_05145 [Candidatus Omnitrophota bacterium]|jgi:hypothetical protein